MVVILGVGYSGMSSGLSRGSLYNGVGFRFFDYRVESRKVYRRYRGNLFFRRLSFGRGVVSLDV